MLPPMDELLTEHADIERQLSDPAIHSDQQLATALGRRYAQLSPIVTAARDHERVTADLAAARELAATGDEEFRTEAIALEAELTDVEEEIRRLLLPKDPFDDKDVILEIKAGEGGEESALFAGDLLRMYLRYAERQGWKTEILDSVESDLGGYKDVSVAVKGRRGGVWPRLKFEGGVHRVQRVPVTESQGRIHTSAAGVFVFPEAAEVEVSIDPNDLRVDVYRSSGPGGQSVNTTDSAVRITHVPTGVVASCQNEKSQLQNKEQAMRILRARLLALAQEEQAAQESAARAGQVRTVDRSERVRTYNYPENRVADHRVGYKAHNLDALLDGDLDALVQALSDGEAADQLNSAHV
jgi:peptide chain release factor 1